MHLEYKQYKKGFFFPTKIKELFGIRNYIHS